MDDKKRKLYETVNDMAENAGRVMYNNERPKYYRINQWAIIAICIWAIVPYVRARTGDAAIIVLFGIWLVTTDLKWLTEKWTKDMILLLIFFVTFLPYLITGNLRYGIHGPRMILLLFPIFFMGIFINHYYMHYKNDYNTLGKIALFSLISFTIGSIQTFLGLQTYPLAARALANGFTSVAVKEMYARLGIGGYPFVYAGCFILVLALYPLLRKKDINIKYRLLGAVSFISLAVVITRASFTIALLMSMMGVAVVLLGRSRRSVVIILVVSAVFFLVFPRTLVAEVFVRLAGVFYDNATIRVRLLDFSDNLLSESLGNMTGGRINKYVDSFVIFAKNPLFGIYGPFGDKAARLGGHSGWLDTLAFYGLLTGIPLFATLYYHIKKNINYFKDGNYSAFYIVISFMFVLLGVINPTITVYTIGMAFFLIVPAIKFLPYAFINNEDIPERSGSSGVYDALQTGRR